MMRADLFRTESEKRPEVERVRGTREVLHNEGSGPIRSGAFVIWWKQLGAAGTGDHGFRSSFPHGIKGFGVTATSRARLTTH